MRERSSVFLISRSLAALPGGGGWRGGEGRGSGSPLHLTRFFLRAVGGCVSKHRKQGSSHPKCNSRLEALAVMNSSLVTHQGQRYKGHPPAQTSALGRGTQQRCCAATGLWSHTDPTAPGQAGQSSPPHGSAIFLLQKAGK